MCAGQWGELQSPAQSGRVLPFAAGAVQPRAGNGRRKAVLPGRGVPGPSPGKAGAALGYSPSGSMFQMFLAYSSTARSLEKIPMLAVLRIEAAVQASGSRYSALTASWAARQER